MIRPLKHCSRTKHRALPHRQATGRRRTLWAMILVLILSPVLETILFSSYAKAVNIQETTFSIAGNVKNCGVMQGGTTDGTSLYFACRHNSDTAADIDLVKLDLQGNELKRKTYTKRSTLGHANDMTFNKSINSLIVSTWDVDGIAGRGLALVDPTTLEFKEAKELRGDGGTSSSICYNAAKDIYVSNGFIYDNNFRSVKRIYSDSQVDSDLQTTSGKVLNQGIDCDASHIYVMRQVDKDSKSYSRIGVYSYEGKITNAVELQLNDEGENLFSINGILYMGVNEGSMSAGGNSKNDYYIKIPDIATSNTASARPIVVGSFNVLGAGANGGEGSCNGAFKNRMETVAKNINDMGMDVVGIQEYTSSEVCGSSKPLLDALGSDWKITNENTPGGTLKENETAVIWNTKQVSLIDVDVRVIPNWKGATSGCHSLSGGSWNIPVAHFQSIGGQEFYTASSHWINGGDSTTKDFCLTQRIKDTEVILGWLKEFRQKPVFLVGDTNSKIGYDPTIHPTIKENGFLDASTTATAKENANISTMAATGVSNDKDVSSHIDRIFYNQSAGTPSKYITLACRSISACGSDHRPIAATFPGILVGGSDGSCGSTTSTYTENQTTVAWGVNHYGQECTCSTASGLISGSTNFAKIANYFSSKGLKDIAIAGLLANLHNESRLSAFSIQSQEKNTADHNPPPTGAGYGIAQFTPSTKIGSELNSDPQTSGYYSQYFSTKYGGYTVTPWNDGGNGIPDGVPTEVNDAWLETQLDFIYNGEMQSTKVGTYRDIGGDMDATREYNGEKYSTSYISDKYNILEALAASKDEKDAARIFVWVYERPADKSGAAAGREALATEMLSMVQSTISTGSSSGQSCGAPATTTNGNFAETVKAFAWEDGRRGSQQKEAYTKALEGRYKGGNNGNDCGAFVSALMVKSGFEPDYPGTSTPGQGAWLSKNWKKIADVGKVDVGKLLPGDVAIIPGSHVFVWIGEVDGFKGKSAEAALGSNTAPTAILPSNTFSDPSKYTWYRKE